MLKIRLQRTGRKNRAEYRIVVAEKSKAVKKSALEILGHYLPTRDPKVIEMDVERIQYWIDRGAQPSDTVAYLCKTKGMADMDKYLAPRNRNRPKKNPEEVAEEPKKEEAPAKEPKKEEAPAEEPKKEEKPAEEPKKEEKPAE